MNKSHAIITAVVNRAIASGSKPIAGRPADIILPEGWTWERVEEERAKWGIDANMIPITSVPGVAVAWGTINSVRRCKGD